MKRTNKIASLLAALLIFTAILGSLSACSSNSLYTEGSGSLNVVCTSFPPFDFARQVGKDKITLTVLQDNGADLHNYSPTAKTLAALNTADVFICVGGESDKKWVQDAIDSAQNPDLKTVFLMDGLELKHAELTHLHESGDHSHSEHEDEHGEDEHVWLSLKNAAKIADTIASAFSEKDTENADAYRANADAFKSDIAALDGEFESAVAAAKTKTVVVADRFPFIYLTSDYDICYYAAFSGCSTEVNSDFATQVKLIEAVREHGLSAVIVTEGSNKELADNIVSETGCKKVTMNSMQSVTRSEIQDGATYLEIMTKNLAALREALS